MDDAYLTTEEVLEYLQVNLRTVYRLIKAGRLPAVRVGRQWRVRRADLDHWLGGQRAGSTSMDAPDDVTSGALDESESPRRPTAGGPRRVLVVDDEAGIRDLLKKTLALAECDVDAAADGPAALDYLRKHTYRLMITDLKMPGMDGLTLVREARRLAPDIPVVVITAHSTEATAIESVNLGVSGYLTKPFRITKILTAVERIIGD